MVAFAACHPHSGTDKVPSFNEVRLAGKREDKQIDQDRIMGARNVTGTPLGGEGRQGSAETDASEFPLQGTGEP